MQAHTKTVEEALTEGVFDIPDYQRSYSWEQRQWEEFLQDIRFLPEESSHFFGNIILEEQDEYYQADSGAKVKAYDVVDGQQRLTTVILFLRVASELDENIHQQLDAMNTLFLPEDRPRLLPTDQDHQFFRDDLLGEANHSPETPSQQRLRGTYEFFHDEMQDLKARGTVTIQELTDRLRHNFTLNIVETEGESEAAAIFEGLNDRGKPLSSLEKTKSLLVNMDGRANRRGGPSGKIDERFGKIYRKLFVLSNGHDRAADFDEDAFQRFHWGLYDGYDPEEYSSNFETLKKRLYERYRSEDYKGVRDDVDDYSLRLCEAADAFEDLFRPEKRPESIQEPLQRLLELGRVANVVPVLMAAHLEYGDGQPDAMKSIVEQCETLVFRVYSIDRRRSNTGRSKLISLAHSIHTDDSFGVDEITRRLAEITREYTDDERFENALTDGTFYKNVPSREIRYLLYHYGHDLDVDIPEDTHPPLDEILGQNFHVEHILSRELRGKDLPDDFNQFRDSRHRLGNLTITNQYWNNQYSNLPFEEKKEADSHREVAYKNSDLRVQQVLAEYDEFTGEKLEEREQKIVEFALQQWALDD